MNAGRFANALSALKFDNVFNPYSDRCDISDFVDAPKRRLKVLAALLEEASTNSIDSLWIGRDLGYRGGRRTGLALTDDLHVSSHAERWGIMAKRATRDAVVAERTAAVIWSMLDRIDSRIFLWNVFPLHPHEPDAPFTNRAHNSKERRMGEDILTELIELLRPKRLIAIGNDAAAVGRRISKVDVIQVRHPSYGGQNDFIKQVSAIYELRPIEHRQARLF